jgi:head-tail adaptor
LTKRKYALHRKNQPFDTSLKGWVKENPATIIPLLLPEAVFQEAVDVEAIKPTMRADRVFKVLYRKRLCILHIEFETGADSKMRARLLAYNAILFLEHELPVISIIVYPFRTTIAISPLRVECGTEELLTFHFSVLPLFELEAERYIQKHIICMYPLLPAMQGANAELITRAMTELAELYREDEVSLSQQFVWMELLLERTTMISSAEKAKIQEDIKMYDPLWEEHPKVKKFKAEARAEVKKARAEAEAEKAKAWTEAEKARVRAEIEAETRVKAAEAIQAYNKLRDDILQIVQIRFPTLVELANQKVEQISSPDVLHFLLVQVASAANETVARNILHPSAA